MDIWMREDGTITDEGDPTAFEYVPAVQRDALREALKDAMRYFDQVIVETGYQSEGERITHEQARAALEETEGK